MKRIQSSIHQNIKIDPRTDIRYFRRGSLEFSLKTTDDNEALERMELRLAMLEGTGKLAQKFRVKALYLPYLNEREAEHKGKMAGRKRIRAGTIKEIKYIFNSHLLPFFGNKKLADINEQTWDAYCRRAKVSDLSNHRKVFSKFLKWCKRKGYLRALPDITDIPEHKRRKRRILNPNEITILVNNAEGRLLLIVTMALFMGMRIGEIVELAWDRTDLINKALFLRDEDVKTDAARELPINSFVLKLLIAERARQQNEGIKTRFVFYNHLNPKTHTHKTTFGAPWRRLVARCGFEPGYITFHDLRATWKKYSNKSTSHTDTQREKMAGSSIEVQKRIYVSMTADDLRGLEEVVQVQGLDQILVGKLSGRVGENTGKEN